MEITDLTIIPEKAHPSHIACCTVTFDSALIISGIHIRENKNGIYVQFPSAFNFTDEEYRKEASNRILATYVINHCSE